MDSRNYFHTRSIDSSSPLDQGSVGSKDETPYWVVEERAERAEENWSLRKGLQMG